MSTPSPAPRGIQARACQMVSRFAANDPVEAEVCGAEGRLLHRRRSGALAHAAGSGAERQSPMPVEQRRAGRPHR